MTAPRRAILLFLVGMALIQGAWVLAVPPFRGVDEFDHVYRAASLVHGQLRPIEGQVLKGRGDYVRVPRSIVTDAGPVCSTYGYVGTDNCYPAEELDGDFVKVASAAARYNPVFYGVVGSIAQPFAGAAFVYAARMATVAFCLALWGLAALAATKARRPRAVLFGMALAATPVLTYSGSIVAPNGVEIAAAVACWASLLALGNPQSQGGGRMLLTTTTLAACLLVLLRTAGPVWFGLILLSVLALPGRRERLKVLRDNRVLALGCAVAVTFAAAASAVWILTTRTNYLSEEAVYQFEDPWQGAFAKVPLWVFQSIAAFPTRGEQAPTVVYALVAAGLVAAFVSSPFWSERRWRLTLLAMLAIWLIPPYIFTALTYVESGAIWQGRYSLPYSIGIPIVLLSWSSAVSLRRSSALVVGVTAAICYAGAAAVSIANVRRVELVNSPLAGDERWFTVPELLIIALAVGGSLMVFAASAPGGRSGRAAPVSAADGVLTK